MLKIFSSLGDWLSATGGLSLKRLSPPLKGICPPKILKKQYNEQYHIVLKNNGLLSFAPLKFFSSRKPGRCDITSHVKMSVIKYALGIL